MSVARDPAWPKGRPLVTLRVWGLAAALLLGSGGWALAGVLRSATTAAGVEAQAPALTREQILLIHDATTQREHLILELGFSPSEQPWGVLIPIPTRPELAELRHSPFTALRPAFPYTRFEPRAGVEPVQRVEGVDLVETTRLASATVFVLAADDADALGEWLVANDLVRDPPDAAWLARYVALGFQFVALRYEPPATRAGAAQTEQRTKTLRVSFDTPLPYLPYREPDGPRPQPFDSRVLELWYVGAAPVVPVALRERDGQRAWVQPLRRGLVDRDARVSLTTALGPELAALLPPGPLVVQTFQDQKREREGFGDLLFASEQPQTLTPAQVAELEPLLGLLDPALAPTSPEPKPEPEPQPEPQP